MSSIEPMEKECSSSTGEDRKTRKGRSSAVAEDSKIEKERSSAMAEDSKIEKERSSAMAEDKKCKRNVLPPRRNVKNVKEMFFHHGGR